MYGQQGDCLLFKTESFPIGTPITSGVLHRGDNNTHIITGKHLLCEYEGVTYLNALEDCELGHDEHGASPINVRTVSPGIYRKGIVMEYDHATEESRNIKD